MTQGCTYIGIRKLEFVEKIQYLYEFYENLNYFHFKCYVKTKTKPNIIHTEMMYDMCYFVTLLVASNLNVHFIILDANRAWGLSENFSSPRLKVA